MPLPAFFAAPMAKWIMGSMAFSFMGSLATINNYKQIAKFNKQKNDIELAYKRISLNKKTARLLSEQRAGFSASGIAFTGSPLIVQNETITSYENDLWWIEKGAVLKATEIDIKLAGRITNELYSAGSSLIQGGMDIWSANERAKAAEKGIVTNG